MKNFLLVLIILCFFSCENNFKEIKDINSYNFYPVGVSQNFKLIYTDSAKVKATLTALLNNDYTNQEFPYSEFPEGIEITFFDSCDIFLPIMDILTTILWF